jgi:hypothetical protein
MLNLEYTAWKYAANELNEIDRLAFELKLSEDQSAREALAEAIRLSAMALGQTAPQPNPEIKVAVAEQLKAPKQKSLLSQFFARRQYRGHPLAWVSCGVLGTICMFGFDRKASNKTETYVSPPTTEFVSVVEDNSTTQKSAVSQANSLPQAGAEKEQRPMQRPSTFLPEFPMLDPMGG